jgi:hypothetical protein
MCSNPKCPICHPELYNPVQNVSAYSITDELKAFWSALGLGNANPYGISSMPTPKPVEAVKEPAEEKMAPDEDIVNIVDIEFSDKRVVIRWSDGQKTHATAGPNDTFDPQVGFALAFARYWFGAEDLKTLTDMSYRTSPAGRAALAQDEADKTMKAAIRAQKKADSLRPTPKKVWEKK